jgi:threonine/homoserine/homoserine lactone efflux protein
MIDAATDPVPEVALALAGFAFVMSITPGPNNFMLLASGARFGFVRTVPHVLGITFGFAMLLALAWAGVAGIALAHPAAMSVLAAGCALYLCWLAIGLMRSAAPAPEASHVGQTPPALGAQRAPQAPSSGTPTAPMTGLQAVLFQFVNPKGWAMAVAAAGLVGNAPVGRGVSFGLLVGICSLVNLPCVLVWATFGAALRRALHRRAVHRVFTLSMGLALLLTALWMLRPLLDPAAGGPPGQLP